MVVEERDRAVGVDAVERECRLVLLLRTAARTRSQQCRVRPPHGSTRPALRTARVRSRECSSSRAARTSLAARSRREFVLLACQVRLGADSVDVCPLGGLHPLVCALEPVQLLRLLVEFAFAAHEVAQGGVEFADLGCDLGEPVGGGEADDGRVGEVAVRAAAAVAGLPVAGDAWPVAVEGLRVIGRTGGRCRGA